ncbi:hypothetical protein NMY22_g12264 [Coprinellus aureogranulatus]|nr:hypothetical protein NMY22_g12264 [Coprinellus aureogranulatus]
MPKSKIVAALPSSPGGEKPPPNTTDAAKAKKSSKDKAAQKENKAKGKAGKKSGQGKSKKGKKRNQDDAAEVEEMVVTAQVGDPERPKKKRKKSKAAKEAEALLVTAEQEANKEADAVQPAQALAMANVLLENAQLRQTVERLEAQQAAASSSATAPPEPTIKLIPRPPGTAGDLCPGKGFPLEPTVMQSTEPWAYSKWDEYLKDIRDFADMVKLDVKLQYKSQDTKKIGRIITLMQAKHSYLCKERFPRGWPICEMIKSFVRNQRKGITKKAKNNTAIANEGPVAPAVHAQTTAKPASIITASSSGPASQLPQCPSAPSFIQGSSTGGMGSNDAELDDAELQEMLDDPDANVDEEGEEAEKVRRPITFVCFDVRLLTTFIVNRQDSDSESSGSDDSSDDESRPGNDEDESNSSDKDK